MALSFGEKASIRRHLGLTAAGSPWVGSSSGLRTVLRSEQIENALNNIDPPTTAILLGEPYGVALVFDPVGVGDTVAATVLVGASGQTAKASVAVGPANTAATVVKGLAAILAPQLPGFEVVGYMPLEALRGKLVLRSLSAGTFSLTVSVTNPNLNGPTTYVFLESDGDTYPSPSYQMPNGNVVYGVLACCDALEAALLSASQNLAFANVGSKTVGGANFDRAELAMRDKLLGEYRRALGKLLFPA